MTITVKYHLTEGKHVNKGEQHDAPRLDVSRLRWAVCFDTDADMYDDHRPRTSVVALFDYSYLAEDFINLCLPAENRTRFYIKRVEE